MIAILGGGIAGATLARALALRGRRDVVVFDPNPPVSGSTGRATGGFRTQFTSKLNIDLSLASRPFFAQRAEQIGFRSVGYLYVAEDAAGADELAWRAEVQRAEGLPITHPDPKEIAPFLDPALITATNFCALDGTFLPQALLRQVIAEGRDAGVTFRYEHPVNLEDLDAEIIVVAAGAWSREVGAALDVELAVEPAERGVFIVDADFSLPERAPLVVDVGQGWVMRERERRLLVVPPGDPNNWPYVQTWLQRRIPSGTFTEPAEHWTGYYEMTFDHHPLAGETSRPGVWANCGFSGHGVMHAPAIAESLAAMILGQTPPIDIAAFNPQRTEALSESKQP